LPGKTHLDLKIGCFKYIFRILIKFPILQLEKTVQNLVQSGRKDLSKFELLDKDKIAGKTHL